MAVNGEVWAGGGCSGGDLLSGGLILPLNLCVGVIVACTMYTFYILFLGREE